MVSNLLPAVPSLVPTNQFQSMTVLLNAFIAPFIASFGAATIRNIIGESVNTSLVHSHWSRNVEAWLSLVESFIVMLRQLSYAIKNQLVASKAPY